MNAQEAKTYIPSRREMLMVKGLSETSVPALLLYCRFLENMLARCDRLADTYHHVATDLKGRGMEFAAAQAQAVGDQIKAAANPLSSIDDPQPLVDHKRENRKARRRDRSK